MSVTLAHPFRLDSAGSAAIVPQGGKRHALEIVRHIISCRVGERPLAGTALTGSQQRYIH